MACEAQHSYWDRVFADPPTSKEDWIVPFPAVSGLLAKHLQPADHILIVGCGISGLALSLYHELGCRNVISTDISEVAIQQMSAKHADTPLVWKVADATSLEEFPDGSFDAVIDKGTSDTFFFRYKSNERYAMAEKMFTAVHRVLRLRGRYIDITPRKKVPFLEKYFPLCVSTRLEGDTTVVPGRDGRSRPAFAHVCVKTPVADSPGLRSSANAHFLAVKHEARLRLLAEGRQALRILQQRNIVDSTMMSIGNTPLDSIEDGTRESVVGTSIESISNNIEESAREATGSCTKENARESSRESIGSNSRDATRSTENSTRESNTREDTGNSRESTGSNTRVGSTVRAKTVNSTGNSIRESTGDSVGDTTRSNTESSGESTGDSTVTFIHTRSAESKEECEQKENTRNASTKGNFGSDASVTSGESGGAERCFEAQEVCVISILKRLTKKSSRMFVLELESGVKVVADASLWTGTPHVLNDTAALTVVHTPTALASAPTLNNIALSQENSSENSNVAFGDLFRYLHEGDNVCVLGRRQAGKTSLFSSAVFLLALSTAFEHHVSQIRARLSPNHRTFAVAQ